MARKTLTTTTQALITVDDKGPNQASREMQAKTFDFWAPSYTGTALLKSAPTEEDPTDVDMTDAATWDFSKFIQDGYIIEPGYSLYAKTASGTLDIHILEHGQK